MRTRIFGSIRNKLLAGFIVSALLVAVVGAFAGTSLAQINSAHNKVADEAQPASAALSEVELNATALGSVAREEALSVEVNESLINAGLAGDVEYGTRTEAAIRALSESLSTLRSALPSDDRDAAALERQISSRGLEFTGAARDLVAKAEAAGSASGLQSELQLLDTQQGFLLQPIRELKTSQAAVLADSDAQINNAISRGFQLTIALGIVAVGFAILFGWWLSRRISQPIRQLQTAAVEVGRGNFASKVAVGGTDEVGVLGRAFNQMVDDITKSTVSKGYVDNIIRSMPDSLIVVDRQGRIETVNHATLTMLNYEAMDLLGEPISSVMGRAINAPDGDARAAWLETLSRQGMVANIERTYVRSDGIEVPVLFSASMLRNSAGRVEGIVCVAQDITERKKAEDQLRESEERTRVVIDTALDAVVTTDAEGRVNRWNRRAEETFGWSSDEISGKSLVETIAGSASKTDIGSLFTHVNGNGFGNGNGTGGHEGRRIEITALRRDGQEFPAEISVSEAEASGSTMYSAFIRDISERKEAEERLHQAQVAVETSEIRLRAIVDTALDANVTMSSDGNITGWNNTATQIFGWEHDEAVGRQLSATIIPESLREQHEQGLRHYLSTGEGPVLNQRIEIVALHKDGHEFPIELSISPIDTPEGKAFSAFISDISERKQAEEELQKAAEAVRESEEQLQTILESSPDLIISTGMDARIIFSNSASTTLLGYSTEEMVGKLTYDMVHLEDLPRVLEVFASAGNHEAGTAIEMRMRHAEGTWLWFESSFRFFYDEEDNPYGAVVISRDITERKRSEAELRNTTEELQRSNEELSQFAYVASHDLQEPLRMVSSYTKLLARRYEGRLDENADEYIHFAVDGVTRMQKLIDDLLTYSRVGTRGRPTETAEVRAIVDKALENLKPLVSETGATITLDESLPEVTGDATQLTQVFQNLINNAMKYRATGTTPEVTVGSRRKAGEWVFSVRDNGIGIDPKYQEKVFALFQRLHGRDEFEGGTGIGLAICKKIVERHGGRIWVESAEGEGSTFYFTIPDFGETEEKEEQA